MINVKNSIKNLCTSKIRFRLGFILRIVIKMNWHSYNNLYHSANDQIFNLVYDFKIYNFLALFFLFAGHSTCLHALFLTVKE